MNSRLSLWLGRPTSPAPRSTSSSSSSSPGSSPSSSPRSSATFDWEASELAQEVNEASSSSAWRRLTARMTQSPGPSREQAAVGFPTATVLQGRRLARNIHWAAIRREFQAEPGQPFFIRVPKASANDWRAMVAAIRQSGHHVAVERFDGRGSQPVSKLRHAVTVDLNDRVQLQCRAVLERDIELKFDPCAVQSETDFRLLCAFIEALARALGRAVDIADDEKVLFRATVEGDFQAEWCPKGA